MTVAAASSSYQQVDHTVAPCTAAGPISAGAKLPRPPPSIIAGPAMPMLELRVAMRRSAAPKSAALPAKQ
jgi:hypothetical protein